MSENSSVQNATKALWSAQTWRNITTVCIRPAFFVSAPPWGGSSTRILMTSSIGPPLGGSIARRDPAQSMLAAGGVPPEPSAPPGSRRGRPQHRRPRRGDGAPRGGDALGEPHVLEHDAEGLTHQEGVGMEVSEAWGLVTY